MFWNHSLPNKNLQILNVNELTCRRADVPHWRFRCEVCSSCSAPIEEDKTEVLVTKLSFCIIQSDVNPNGGSMKRPWKRHEKIWKNIQEEESIKQTTNAACADVLGYSGYMRLHCYTSLLAVWCVNMCDVWCVIRQRRSDTKPMDKPEKTDGIRPKMAQATKPIFCGPLPMGQPVAATRGQPVGHPSLRWSIQRLERGYFDTSTYTSKNRKHLVVNPVDSKKPCHNLFWRRADFWIDSKQAIACLENATCVQSH